MKFSQRLAIAVMMAITTLPAGAQRYTNPYSKSNKVVEDSRSFGMFFAEYNPNTRHSSYLDGDTDTNYHGISVGFSYYMPVVGSLGFDAGVKGQYFFRSEKKGSTKYKSNLFAATIPVDIVYDWKLSDGFAIDPFVGVYGRYNFSAKNTDETGNTRNSLDFFDKGRASYFGYNTFKRFQFGWQAGVNFRISEVFTIGGAYWRDLSELGEQLKLHGFNVTVGANF